jgi:hypothetical protein
VILPLAVLAGISIEWMVTHMPRVVSFVVCLLILLVTFMGYPLSLATESNRIYGAYDFQFPKRGYIAAMKNLRTITGKDDIVLALPLAGQIIPSYANRTVYVGNMGLRLWRKIGSPPFFLALTNGKQGMRF